MDATGAGIPQAAIRARHIETNATRAAHTDATGDYALPNLTPGIYEVIVEKEGFRRVQQKSLELQVQQTARLDVQLEVGAVAESIEVTAAAPVLNTENAVKGDVVVNQEIVEMPLNGRSISDLAFMVPEVADAGDANSGSGMAINGARNDNTNFVIDGINNNDLREGGSLASVPLDSVQEFKMQTSGYPAESGKLAGGVMTVALKTGGNRVHGSLFEFLRNDKFDARNFFADGKDKLRRNQFGASLDGPVYIPKLYNGRDRTFFMFTWESYRQETAPAGLAPRARPISSGAVTFPRPPTRRPAHPDARPARLRRLHRRRRPGVFPRQPHPRQPHPVRVAQSRPLLPGRRTGPARSTTSSPPATTAASWTASPQGRPPPLLQGQRLSGRFMRRRNVQLQSRQRQRSRRTSGPTARPGNDELRGITYTRLFTPTVIKSFAPASRARTATAGISTGTPAQDGGRTRLAGVTTEPQLMGFPRINVNDLACLTPPPSQPFAPTANTYNYADTVTWVKGATSSNWAATPCAARSSTRPIQQLARRFSLPGPLDQRPVRRFPAGTPRDRRAPARTALELLLPHLLRRVRSRTTSRCGRTSRSTWRPAVRTIQAAGGQVRPLASFVPDLAKVIVSDSRGAPGGPAGFDRLVANAGLNALHPAWRKITVLPRRSPSQHAPNLAPRFGFAWRPSATTAPWCARLTESSSPATR